MSPKLTVWYNTRCPVCNAGIDRQRNRLLAAARAGLIEFRDINLEPEALQRFGAGLEDIRRRLHAVDDQGRLLVGADCAIAMWRTTPGDAWLGRLAGLPVIRHIARLVYDLFADALYAWNRARDIGETAWPLFGLTPSGIMRAAVPIGAEPRRVSPAFLASRPCDIRFASSAGLSYIFCEADTRSVARSPPGKPARAFCCPHSTPPSGRLFRF